MTSIPAFAQAAFLEFVASHAAKGDADAQKCMDKLPKRSGLPKPSAPGKSRAERRAEHKASTGDLRAFVAERSGGLCEACRGEVGTAWELHHVEGGGSRRPKQRAGNVLCLCWPCHRHAHRGDLATLKMIANAGPLDAEARKAAGRRFDKVLEARGVAVRVEVA